MNDAILIDDDLDPYQAAHGRTRQEIMEAMPKHKLARQSKIESLPPEAFDRVPRVQITLTQETAWLTKFDSGGVETACYPVALGDVAKAFNVVGSSTGLLAADVLFIQNVRGAQRIGIWLAPAKRAITLSARNARAITIPLPGFVFVGQGTQYKIFAATARPNHLRDALYHAPLPNVYGDGGICQGSVKFPRCTMETTRDAAHLFFASEFNHDLAQGKVADVENLYKFLQSLKNKKTFPREKLIHAGKTIRDVMEAR